MVRGVRRRRTTARTVARVVAATAVVLALVTGVSVTLAYRHFNGNLHRVDVRPGPDRPDKPDVEGPHEPLNILVLGSDSRDCDGCGVDGESGGGSDTTVLFHLAADRKSAYGVSIPRDSLVDRPDCYAEDGSVIPGEQVAMWNAAFDVGGPGCTQRQLEQVTGVRVDNVVVVDFGGFRDMVDAVGGVEVCVPRELHSDKGDITIPAGTRTMDGDEAEDYIRIRYGVGDGTDLGRIKRQQAFMASLVHKVLDKNTLARVDRLYGFLDAAIKSLTTDIDSIADLAQIGLQFADIGESRVRFLTVPNQLSVEHEGRVEWLPSAETLWSRIRYDEPLGSLRDGSIGAGDLPTTPSAPASSGGDPTGGVRADPAELDNAGLCT